MPRAKFLKFAVRVIMLGNIASYNVRDEILLLVEFSLSLFMLILLSVL